MEKRLNSLFNYFKVESKKEDSLKNISNNNSSIDNSFTSTQETEKIRDINFDYLEAIPLFTKIVQKTKKLDKDTQIRVYYILESISQGGFNSIDSKELKELMFTGIPDEIPSLRTLLWKLSLNYPSNAKVIHSPKWQEEIDLKRIEYSELKDKHLKIIKEVKSHHANKFKNDPLSNNSNSEWSIYFHDHELFEEIEKDVRRTRAQMSFFFMPVDSSQDISNDEISLKADQIREPTKKGKEVQHKFECHCDVLSRILFIYAKQYPNIRYIQGMNEVLAPIYFQFCLDNEVDNNIFKSTQLNNDTTKSFEKIEADCYFCFDSLMSEINDLFIREKDNQLSGIQARIKKVNDMLKDVDRDIYNHFQNLGIEIQFFMFRWYALLFTQEYELPDVLRLWDSILSFNNKTSNQKEEKFSFLNFLCIAIILYKREEILGSDFATVMLSFQNLENLEVSVHIKMAQSLMNVYDKYN